MRTTALGFREGWGASGPTSPRLSFRMLLRQGKRAGQKDCLKFVGIWYVPVFLSVLVFLSLRTEGGWSMPAGRAPREMIPIAPVTFATLEKNGEHLTRDATISPIPPE